MSNILILIEKLEHSGNDYVDVSKAFVKINEIIEKLNDCTKELDRISKLVSNPLLTRFK